jgi:predicted HNH restriction endonuclease
MKPRGYPSQTEMELPLLKILLKHGGKIYFSKQGDEVAGDLADHFGLTQEQRDYASTEINSKGRNYWRNHIQFVRRKLVEKGFIDNLIRNLWSITDAGRRRVEDDPQWQIDMRAKELHQTITADCESLFPDQTDQGYATPDRSPTYYERDPQLRKMAIELHGTTCKICGFNFADFYGTDKGKDYIEVHHIVPIADVPESRDTDPGRDMTVVCANCHRMIHRKKKSAIHPDDLKSAILPNEEEYGLPRV